jgi:hypothetical protein
MVFVNRLAQLIWAGRVTAAGNAFQSLGNFIRFAANDHARQALRVAFAAADELAMRDDTVLNLQFNFGRASTVCFVVIHRVFLLRIAFDFCTPPPCAA